MRTCQGNGFSPFGLWSGEAPSCRGIQKIDSSFLSLFALCSYTGITCTSLSQINNGLVAYSSSPFNFGTTATYTCNEGFFLQGDRTRTCGGDGSGLNGVWSGSAPVCAGIQYTHLSQKDCASFLTFLKHSCKLL